MIARSNIYIKRDDFHITKKEATYISAMKEVAQYGDAGTYQCIRQESRDDFLINKTAIVIYGRLNWADAGGGSL